LKLVIINYGAGNTQSIQFAFERLGVSAILSNNNEEILSADKIIFPGVGHAESALEILKETKLDLLIPSLKQPVLGICLGMQLMCSFSEEGKVSCLNIFNMPVKRFSSKMKVPHTGWNQIENLKTNGYQNIKEKSFVYFVHSYFVPVCEYTTAICNYSQPFSASLQKNNFYAAQFHPEKSATIGQQFLQNFLSS
jgi:glutamine amidotransferase